MTKIHNELHQVVYLTDTWPLTVFRDQWPIIAFVRDEQDTSRERQPCRWCLYVRQHAVPGEGLLVWLGMQETGEPRLDPAPDQKFLVYGWMQSSATGQIFRREGLACTRNDLVRAIHQVAVGITAPEPLAHLCVSALVPDSDVGPHVFDHD